MMRILHVPVITIITLLWLGGCSSAPPVPVDRFYRLPEPQINADGITVPSSIRIGNFQAQGVYNERAILYIDEQYPLMVRRYHYHLWINSPAELVRDQLIAYVRNNINAKAAKNELEISGRVLRFERLISASQIRVIAELEVRTRGPEAGSSAVTRVYKAEVPAASDRMNDTAAAFGKALDVIFAKVARDIVPVE